MPLALLALLGLTVWTGAQADTVSPRVRAILVGERPGRPPLTRLLVDLSIENAGGVPRWALIPASLPPNTGAGGGINHLEQQTANTGGARAAVGRLLGRAGGYALLLAPGARVTLRQLEIGWWRELPPSLSDIAFEVRFAEVVTVDGQPLSEWFDSEPTIASAAEIDMRATPRTHTRAVPGGRELPIVASKVVPVLVRLASP